MAYEALQPLPRRWFNGVTHKCRFGFGTLFLLLQPKNAFFHRKCGTFSGPAAKTTEYLRLKELA